MRVKRRRNHRLQTGGTALAALAACLLAAGCQEPQLDHVDGSSTTFNANRIPTVDRQKSPAEAGPQNEIRLVSGEESQATPQSPSGAGAGDAVVVDNLNRGHREAAMNHLAEAEACYRRVLEIQPENSVANHRLAVLADKRRDFARAEQYYLTALRNDGHNPDLLGDLGYSYLLQGRREESERYLLAATQVDPSHSKALHNLSLLYAQNGDYDRSFDALRRAVGETEARAKIVRLFPNGRPAASDEAPTVASFQPSEPPDGNSPAAQRESADAPSKDGALPQVPIGPADSIASFDADVLPPAAPSAAPAPAPASAPAATAFAPAPVAAATNGHVPDSRINELFSAIDRETAHQPPEAGAFPAPARTDVAPPAMAAQSSASTPAMRGAGAGALDAQGLQAAPGADPLASMPLWAPAAPRSQQQKPPAEFLFDEDPHSKAPRAVATGIVPISGVTADARAASATGDGLSQFEADLQRDKTVVGGRTQSNAGPPREPLFAQRPQTAQNVSGIPKGTADGATDPPPFETAPLHIQPRNNPAPLFEPVEGFGPGNDFTPGDDGLVPAWPGTNGNPIGSNGSSADGSPAIHPRPAN